MLLALLSSAHGASAGPLQPSNLPDDTASGEPEAASGDSGDGVDASWVPTSSSPIYSPLPSNIPPYPRNASTLTVCALFTLRYEAPYLLPWLANLVRRP